MTPPKLNYKHFKLRHFDTALITNFKKTNRGDFFNQMKIYEFDQIKQKIHYAIVACLYENPLYIQKNLFFFGFPKKG